MCYTSIIYKGPKFIRLTYNFSYAVTAVCLPLCYSPQILACQLTITFFWQIKPVDFIWLLDNVFLILGILLKQRSYWKAHSKAAAMVDVLNSHFVWNWCHVNPVKIMKSNHLGFRGFVSIILNLCLTVDDGIIWCVSGEKFWHKFFLLMAAKYPPVRSQTMFNCTPQP